MLGSFLLKGSQGIVLDVRSIERATQAILFFDKHIPRKMMRLKDGLIVNRLFDKPEDGVSTFDHFFVSFDTTGPSSSALPNDLESRMAAVKTPEAKAALVHQLVEEFRNKPLPEIECFPIHFYEEGILQLELMLKTRQHVAYQHFIGNKNYTLYDYAMSQT